MSATISLPELKRMAANAGPGSPLHALIADVEKKAKGKKERKAPTPPPPSQRRVLKLVVPMPPNLNPKAKESRNPFAANGRRTKYWHLLDQLVEARLIPAPPQPCFGVVIATSMMIVGGRMDRDNSVSRHKHLFDWLQDRGYLHNDRLVEWSDFPRQRIERPRRGGLATVIPAVAAFGVHRIELELREP